MRGVKVCKATLVNEDTRRKLVELMKLDDLLLEDICIKTYY